ncbi:hypothetical protein MMC25_001696 [Agyrium rufum]|nr:hypothetical protein [Agyrium rufum]
MALVAASRTSGLPADPTASLTQALQNFQNTLTDEQKAQYLKACSKPDPASTYEFVKRIDEENTARRGKCVSTRLHTFLDATQRFAGIVDTFISSNPAVAALVWGGIKTAILAASNIASYYDKVTNMIMRIGQSCPTYQQFGQLYPQSIGLQAALCDYYAIFIRLCISIIEVSRRSTAIQYLSSLFNPFESEFKPFLEDLSRATKDVHLQIELASRQADFEAAKLLELDSKENAAYRRSILGFNKDARDSRTEAQQWRIRNAARKAAKMKSAIRANLSTIDHVQPWKLAFRQRSQGTAEWFEQTSSFCDWKDDKNTAILWCSGTLGVGKTILVSNIVAALHTSKQQQGIISYFFCRSDREESLRAKNIMGSIAGQLLEYYIEHAKDDVLETLLNGSKDLAAAEVTDFLSSHLDYGKTHYIVLDGLDDCAATEVRAVAEGIGKLCKSHTKGLKFLIAGCPELEQEIFRTFRPNHRMIFGKEKADTDIERYVNAELEACLEENRLVIGDPTIVLTIVKSLREGSDGMFLWASLMIEEITAQRTDKAILHVLEHLPHKLADLFDRKLHRITENSSGQDATKILQFCGVTKRPLTVEELRELLSVEPDQKFLDKAGLPNDMKRIVADCCGLVFVDEQEDTIHFVHNSVKYHLFESKGFHSKNFAQPRLNKYLGILCLTYLNFNDFKRQIVKVKQELALLVNPLELGIKAISPRHNVGNRIAQRLLRQMSKSKLVTTGDIVRNAGDILETTGAPHVGSNTISQHFCFLTYARVFWIFHLTDLDNTIDEKIWKVFGKCVVDSDIDVDRPWESQQQSICLDPSRKSNFSQEKEITILPKDIQWALVNRHKALFAQTILLNEVANSEHLRVVLNYTIRHNQLQLVEIILRHSQIKQNTLDNALWDCAEANQPEILSVLLLAGADSNIGAGSPYMTALQAAAGGGHLDVVDRLLAAKADVNAPASESNGRTALQAAAGGGHLDVVDRLLAVKADVNARASESYGSRTALQAAAGGGHLDVVDRLLAVKADVNAPASKINGKTALQAAAGGGHLDVVDRLLAAKAEVDAPTSKYDGRTALQAAAGSGHLDVVDRLLAAKADVNAPASKINGKTALQAAAGGGYLDVVNRLLAAKADVNAPTSKYDGRTALQAAAGGGHLDVVDRLLVAKADVNAPTSKYDGRTALQAAAGGGHLDVVDRLLAAKADVNAPASKINGKTALQAAAGGGHLDVVNRLLAVKADVNAPASESYGGRTALQAAAGGGHLDVVKKLEKVGAR